MRAYLRLIRPADWIKNTFVFAALVFGAKVTDPDAVKLSLAAFIAFCMASSTAYVFNDLLDRERDRHHPIKKNRPLASGQVSPVEAVVLIVALLGVAAAISLGLLPRQFVFVVGMYLALNLAYSTFLKHRMLLDVITIAILFVLRAIAGAVAIGVPISEWLLICTFMLCLFLGFGKRRCEIATISESGGGTEHHRPTLVRYTPDLLNHLLSTSAGIAIVTFLLYTLDPRSSSVFMKEKHRLMYTLPLVVYGIYRYAMLVELGKASGPTDLIIKDKPFLATVVLWGVCAVVILYAPAILPF